MHAAVKLIVGIIVFLIGLYWYAAPLFGHTGIVSFLQIESTFRAFVTVFAGLFGALLIILGIIIAWIEYEDLKWARREKAEAAKQISTPEPQPVEAPKRRRGRPRKGEVV